MYCLCTVCYLLQPGETGEEPLYVNAKQYHRILKRRQARAKLEATGRIPKERQVCKLIYVCLVLINLLKYLKVFICRKKVTPVGIPV